jgi:ethanolamine utilization protein EutP (predicted NTPase)
MFKVSPASLQTLIDTPNCVFEDRVQYTTVHNKDIKILIMYTRMNHMLPTLLKHRDLLVTL